MMEKSNKENADKVEQVRLKLEQHMQLSESALEKLALVIIKTSSL